MEDFYRTRLHSEAVLNLSPKAHTKTDTSSQEKLLEKFKTASHTHCQSFDLSNEYSCIDKRTYL